MHKQNRSHGSTSLNHASSNTYIDALLREARRLHRDAKLGRISLALPAIRRVQASGVFLDESVSFLYKSRQRLQRKHFLRILALEAGHNSWEQYKPILSNEQQTPIRDVDRAYEDVSQLNLWFSNKQQALDYVQLHGGQVLSYGVQAVVRINADKQGELL
ncbi:hypothetical protein [uncultured Vibrio sp.]|uniref:hypothetical protein n=1 Tax=uncultured Vibrio sp. TaxID=114054 RepID=UPI0025F569AC|nr:hypothetical protein [uncultured Vibrio sp.]